MTPGLIDLHTHLVGDLSVRGRPVDRGDSAANELLMGVRNAREDAPGPGSRRSATSARSGRSFDLELRDAIDAGWVDGPRMQAAGAFVTVPGGGGEVTG